MNKKCFTKRITALALSVIMVLGMMPLTALAAGYGDNGYDTTHQSSYVIDGNDVYVYITGNGGTVTRISGTDDDSVQQYRAVADENWEFAYWSTYYLGPITQSANPTAVLGYYYFSVPGDEDTAYGKTNSVIQINEEVWAEGVYYLQAIFKPKVTLNVNGMLDAFTPSIRGNSPATNQDNVFVSGSSGYVPYGASVETRISGFSEQYTVESVTVYDGAYRNDFTYEIDYGISVLDVNFTATRPTNVTVNVKVKEQKVTFNANGGGGTMTTQVFNYGTSQALTANNFIRSGYTFVCWNTNSDGSGTSYTDKQSVTFTPTNDGDSITLYAQWTACTNHQWKDGECTKCAAICSHIGGNATCTEQATCSTCGEKYGDLAKHNVVYDSSNNRIVETCIAGCGHTATATIERDANVNTVYTGSAIKALTVSYSDGWQGGSLEIIYSNNEKVGTASGIICVKNATATMTFEILKATPGDLQTPTAQNEINYGSKLNTVGLNDGWTWGNGDIVPCVNNNGYMAFYTPSDITNYDWTNVDGWNAATNRVERTIAVTVNKAPLTITAKDKTIVYGDAPANDGVIYYGFVNSETEDVLGGTLDLSYNYSQYADVGTYTITPSGLISDNYDIAFEEGALTVEQKELIITWGNTVFIYDGTEKFPEFVVHGIVTDDDIKLTRIGAATNTRHEYMGVITGITGDDADNYKLPSNISKEFSISKATPNIGTVSVDGVVTDTTAPNDVVLLRTDKTVSGTLNIVKVVSEFMRSDKSLYDWEFVPNDMQNYNVVYGYVEIDVLDTNIPSAAIYVNTVQWKEFLNTITFGLFFKDSQEVTITYDDNDTGSGLKDMLYYVSDRELDATELESVEWIAYTDAFSIEPDSKYVIYAKAIDNDGNSIIVSSDGLVLDKKVAVVEGITNGGVYYGQVAFDVRDDLSGVKSLLIDNNDKTNSEGQYVIYADNAEHTVIITDNADNVTEYKITVYKNYTVTFMVDGKVLSTEIVGYGKDTTLPTVPAKDGYTGKWNHDGKNITADTEIKAVYIASSIPVPDQDVQSPQTNDNSNVRLWFAILFISGGALFGITITQNKGKNKAKKS